MSSRAPRLRHLPEGNGRHPSTPHHHSQRKKSVDGSVYRMSRSFRRRPWVETVMTQSVGNSEGMGEERGAGEKMEPVIYPRPSLDEAGNEKPTVKVRFGVSFRCHSRQILCMGGSQFPFGWSFVSIAKMPMSWNPVDRWTAEVSLPLGMRLEYKYVILEEQVWTNQNDEDAEGVVEVTYRTGTDPGKPPDVQRIRKQMAIVDWQPGPNRVIQIPDQDEIDRLVPGKKQRRTPKRPRSYFSFRKLDSHPQRTSMNGTCEELYLNSEGEPILDRRDIWPNKGTSLTFEDARRLFLGE